MGIPEGKGCFDSLSTLSSACCKGNYFQVVGKLKVRERVREPQKEPRNWVQKSFYLKSYAVLPTLHSPLPMFTKRGPDPRRGEP